ncbi:MAG: hypothetical protein AB1476_02285 [Candidatus Hadarchaeota archaeon]
MKISRAEAPKVIPRCGDGKFTLNCGQSDTNFNPPLIFEFKILMRVSKYAVAPSFTAIPKVDFEWSKN